MADIRYLFIVYLMLFCLIPATVFSDQEKEAIYQGIGRNGCKYYFTDSPVRSEKHDAKYKVFLYVPKAFLSTRAYKTTRLSVPDKSAFDDAIKAALAKVDLKDTLVVVTADHDHTMTFNGYSAKGNNILDLVKEGADKSIKRDVNGNAITTLAFGNGPNRKDTRTDLTSDQVMADDYLQETGVKLGSETHGGGDVMLFASGANAELFKGTMDNTAVFAKVKSALGL